MMHSLLISQPLGDKQTLRHLQGDTMTHNGLKKILGALLSLSLVLDPLYAAYAPVANGLETNAAAEAGETLGGAVATPKTDNASQFRSGTISTRALPLPKSAISMDFQDADIRDVMHLMAVKSGVNIIYGADVTGPVTVHLDRVPFDQAFQTVLTLKGLVALPVGPRIIRVVSSTSLSSEQSQAATFTKVFLLKYSNAQEIKSPLDAIRTAAGRKGVSSVDSKNNALIITDTIEGLKEVEDLIPTIDRKPQQVDIEAKVVEVTLDNDTKLGISWAFARGDAGSPNFFGQTTASTGDTAAGTSSSVGGTVRSVNPPPRGLGVNFADSSALTQSAFTFLHAEAAFMLSAQITALASKQKVKILSTPHIVAMNNTEATINVVNQIPYQVSTVSNGIASNSVSFVEAGVKLTVKPTVNADRRITLKVKPEVSNPNNAPLAFQGAPPQINTRNAETTVLLRDGETIAIGGLITETNTKTVTGVPLLMSIPLIGYLFKSKEDRIQRTELIVFLTPKIAAE
jgi:type IV pilus assembly protein PilQ